MKVKRLKPYFSIYKQLIAEMITALGQRLRKCTNRLLIKCGQSPYKKTNTAKSCFSRSNAALQCAAGRINNLMRSDCFRMRLCATEARLVDVLLQIPVKRGADE